MDFGVMGLDHHHHNHHHHHNPHQNHHNNSIHNGLGVSSSSSSEAGFASSNVISSSSSPDPETKPITFLYGSELSSSQGKPEKSPGSGLEDYWRSSKVAKTGPDDDFSSACKGVMFQQRNNNNNNSNNSNSASLMRSGHNSSNSNTSSTTTTTLSFLDNNNNNGGYNSHSQQHQMLSFSSSSSSSPTKSEAHALPYFSNALPASYTARSTGYNMLQQQQSGMMMMMRSGPFTASQWMELEHQALIYKYITAAVPIPSNLLIPIRKAFDSAFPPSLLRSNTLGGGWGSAFHLGFSNNADPEPGRCRRTDGKKWRCSRDAVADQKYCERHMNRGRHRSRKPVEGPAAAALTVKTDATTNHTTSASNRMFGKEAREFGSVGTSVVDTNSLHQFIDSWPERTQLSISIPGGGETNLSPLRLSNSTGGEGGGNWMSSSLGGPLGEALNLMPDGSSPTGVLQKPTAFGSLSNSSAGSSPARVDINPTSSSSLPPPAL